jgi:putative heme-binding domain-containing protein
VGPDLAALTDRSTEALLVALLDPNRAVEAKYVNYTAATTAGLTYTGLVAAETATSVTLVGQEAKLQVVLRSDLDSLTSSGKSLMPEGFEKDISPAEMADVITYVQTIGRRPKTLPGNAPQVVTPERLRQQIFCLPSNCEVYGSTLRLEEVNSALGYWNSGDDQAVWTIEIPRAMRYAVLLDVACPAAAAGNTWLVEIDDYRLTGKVEPTASWNTYQRQKAGEVRLEAGRHRLGIRAQGPIRDALFDLKGVVLIPLPGGG